MEDERRNIIKTKNIKKSLQEYASSHNMAYSNITFSLRAIKTYIKTNKNTAFQLFNENVNEIYHDKEKIISNHLEFKQIYAIEVHHADSNIIKLNYSIDFGEFSANPAIIIEPDSTIPYKTNKAQDIFILLVKELNKIKAENKILINIFDASMIDYLKKFTKYIYAGKFIKRVKIPLFEGVEPEITQTSGLVMHFKNKESNKQLIEVEVGEVLVEFIKPIYGKNGLNASGEIIHSGLGTNYKDLHVSIDDGSITIEEDDKHKLYKSSIKGYVELTETKLMVANKVSMSKISRLNSSLSNEEDNNIEVIISQYDTNKDSIGEGAEVISETVHVNGHVGANSIIEAANLQIDGATHKDSIQFARNAIIHRHKGTLRCNNAKIFLLEGGKVHATTVDIESCLGGEIYAKDVTIGLVKNHVKIYASNSITIDLVSGEENLFKINYREIPILMSKLKLLEDDITNLEYSLKEAKRHNKSEVANLEEKIIDSIHEQNKIIGSTKNAKISIKKSLRGLNKIIFTLENKDEILYKTSAQEYSPFYLEYADNKIILHPVNKTIILNS